MPDKSLYRRSAPRESAGPAPEGRPAPRRLRAVDLARRGGVSVQQIRNYLDRGVLPPADRTPSGYRIFTTEHAEALDVARELADGHGWPHATRMLRAVHAGDLDTALTVLDRGHAEADRERAEIERVLGAFDTVLRGAPPGRARARPGGAPRRLRIGEAARVAGVRTSALRVWERYGLLRPARERATGYRVFDEAELRAAQVVALLRRADYPLSIVRAVIAEMRATGSPERVRAELARRDHELRRRSLRRLRGSAALYGYLETRGLARGGAMSSGPPGGPSLGTAPCPTAPRPVTASTPAERAGPS